MAKHTFEEKLDIVSQVVKGTPILWISRERRIDQDMILEWVRKYNLHGESGLRKQANIKSTSDFKEEVVRLIIEKGVPLRQVVLERKVSRSALESWVRLVRVEGYAVLYKQKPRGRPPKVMGRSKKPETELEKLQAENARLRAENALLKKVKALVQEREARERMSGQKPSKN